MTPVDDRVLECADGTVSIAELGGGRRRVSVTPKHAGTYVVLNACSTTYPPALIELILRVKGIQSLCDEIEREERPAYLQHLLWWTVRAHLDEHELTDRRVLDFGCGSGASTMILARMFPRADFLGVDTDEAALTIAEARRRHYGLSNIRFVRSPGPNELPPDLGLGEVDVIVMSAVFEHLLPRERQVLIPKLWATLRPGGVALIGETPHRFSPVETHTTGLPLINYLPAPVALRVARRFSSRVPEHESWEELLRRGIRGGSEGAFLRALKNAGVEDAILRRPSRLGLRDEFDLWYEISHTNELPRLKAALRTVFRGIKRTTGCSFTPYLAFAVEKAAPHAGLPLQESASR